MFNVISKIVYTNKNDSITSHNNNRFKRMDKYNHLMSNEYLHSFIVDTDHHNGLEVHSININGLIYIHNKLTNKLITILHPRPRQLKRYFIDEDIPMIIKELISETHKRNMREGLNEL